MVIPPFADRLIPCAQFTTSYEYASVIFRQTRCILDFSTFKRALLAVSTLLARARAGGDLCVDSCSLAGLQTH